MKLFVEWKFDSDIILNVSKTTTETDVLRFDNNKVYKTNQYSSDDRNKYDRYDEQNEQIDNITEIDVSNENIIQLHFLFWGCNWSLKILINLDNYHHFEVLL